MNLSTASGMCCGSLFVRCSVESPRCLLLLTSDVKPNLLLNERLESFWDALLLLWPTRSTLGIVGQLLTVFLAPRLGGLRCRSASGFGFSEGHRICNQHRSRYYTVTFQCGAVNAHGVVKNLSSTASGPVSTALPSRSGAAFCCWLEPWPYTALLCCNGPFPL